MCNIPTHGVVSDHSVRILKLVHMNQFNNFNGKYPESPKKWKIVIPSHPQQDFKTTKRHYYSELEFNGFFSVLYLIRSPSRSKVALLGCYRIKFLRSCEEGVGSKRT